MESIEDCQKVLVVMLLLKRMCCDLHTFDADWKSTSPTNR